jgi:hypothetical protein
MPPKRKQPQRKRGKRREQLSDYDSDEELYDEHPEDREMSIDEALALIEESKKETRRVVVNGYGKVIGYLPDPPADRSSERSVPIKREDKKVFTTPPRSPDQSVPIKREDKKVFTTPPRSPDQSVPIKREDKKVFSTPV